MKLSSEALLEIMAIIQDGLLGEKDASQGLRELDLTIKHGIPEVEGGNDPTVGQIVLTEEYVASHPRSQVWEDEPNEELN